MPALKLMDAVLIGVAVASLAAIGWAAITLAGGGGGATAIAKADRLPVVCRGVSQ